MKCPVCGKTAKCIDSRHRATGDRYRRYECTSLHRFSTVETIVNGKNQRLPTDDMIVTENE